MASELVYTSAEHGLKPRSSGFCTVAMTHGMPMNLCERLESLSGYRTCFPSHDPLAAYNPVHVSYYRFTLGAIPYLVLSRVAYYGVDYTGRSNKLAHHVVLRADEVVSAGPTAVARHDRTFFKEWQSEPRLFNSPRSVEAVTRLAGPARYWQEVVGDAGWAGVIAQHTLHAPDTTTVLLFSPGAEAPDLLRLLDECMMLIPPAQRWDITFSTYLTDLPIGTTCRWRCLLAGSAEWERVRRAKNLLVLDLTKRPWQQPADSPMVTAARTGEIRHEPAAPTTSTGIPLAPVSGSTAAPNRSFKQPFVLGNSSLAELAETAADGPARRRPGPLVAPKTSAAWRWSMTAGLLALLAMGSAWTVFWLRTPRGAGALGRGSESNESTTQAASAVASTRTSTPEVPTTTQVAAGPSQPIPPVVPSQDATTRDTAPTTTPSDAVVSTAASTTRPAAPTTSPSSAPKPPEEAVKLTEITAIGWAGQVPSPGALASIRLWHEVKTVGRWSTEKATPKFDRSRVKAKAVVPGGAPKSLKLKTSDVTVTSRLTIELQYENPETLSRTSYVVWEVALDPIKFSSSGVVSSPTPKDLTNKALREEFLRLITQGSMNLYAGERILGRFEFAGPKDLEPLLGTATQQASVTAEQEKEEKAELDKIASRVEGQEAILKELGKTLNLDPNAMKNLRTRLRDSLKMKTENAKEIDQKQQAHDRLISDLQKWAKVEKAEAARLYKDLEKTLDLEDNKVSMEAATTKYHTAQSASKAAEDRLTALQMLKKEVELEQGPFLRK